MKTNKIENFRKQVAKLTVIGKRQLQKIKGGITVGFPWEDPDYDPEWDPANDNC